MKYTFSFSEQNTLILYTEHIKNILTFRSHLIFQKQQIIFVHIENIPSNYNNSALEFFYSDLAFPLLLSLNKIIHVYITCSVFPLDCVRKIFSTHFIKYFFYEFIYSSVIDFRLQFIIPFTYTRYETYSDQMHVHSKKSTNIALRTLQNLIVNLYSDEYQ